MLDIVSKSRQ